MDRFKDKYRIASARAPFWDYAWNAAYFVTICTKNREHWFGKITDGVMDLSDIGEIVQSEWFKTFEMRPDMNLWMGEYVVMQIGRAHVLTPVTSPSRMPSSA